jgi:hypothetical protein
MPINIEARPASRKGAFLDPLPHDLSGSATRRYLMENRICNKCGKDLPLTEFNHHNECKEGRRHTCKECVSIEHKEYLKKPGIKEHLKEYQSDYYKLPEAKNHKAECQRDRRHRNGINQPMSKNRHCSSFLGVVIAEQILSKEFRSIKRMPYGNPGFDFLCGKGKKIDVKSTCRIIRGRWSDTWSFSIKRNQS